MATVNDLKTLRTASGCDVNVTGGTETGHASGTYSHWNGYQADIAHTACVDSYVKNSFTRTSTRSDGSHPLAFHIRQRPRRRRHPLGHHLLRGLQGLHLVRQRLTPTRSIKPVRTLGTRRSLLAVATGVAVLGASLSAAPAAQADGLSCPVAYVCFYTADGAPTGYFWDMTSTWQTVAASTASDPPSPIAVHRDLQGLGRPTTARSDLITPPHPARDSPCPFPFPQGRPCPA
ncbi:hypothetical protein [Streptomyces sp. LMG1-1-1.1]|uniref:hypothetical protein n=1 Tax=Streptomyces sp. LMG1-1-1.1 TaxID=3135245 RepID=UPI0034660137